MASSYVTVLRGLPGCGKTRLARAWSNALVARGSEGPVILSADDFHIGRDGVYRYDSAKEGEAHQWSLRMFLDAMSRRVARVVIDNTSLTVAEIAPYYAVAQSYGYDATIYTLDVPRAVCESRQTHGVPAHVFDAMEEQLTSEVERFPPWWTHIISA